MDEYRVACGRLAERLPIHPDVCAQPVDSQEGHLAVTQGGQGRGSRLGRRLGAGDLQGSDPYRRVEGLAAEGVVEAGFEPVTAARRVRGRVQVEGGCDLVAGLPGLAHVVEVSVGRDGLAGRVDQVGKLAQVAGYAGRVVDPPLEQYLGWLAGGQVIGQQSLQCDAAGLGILRREAGTAEYVSG